MRLSFDFFRGEFCAICSVVPAIFPVVTAELLFKPSTLSIPTSPPGEEVVIVSKKLLVPNPLRWSERKGSTEPEPNMVCLPSNEHGVLVSVPPRHQEDLKTGLAMFQKFLEKRRIAHRAMTGGFMIPGMFPGLWFIPPFGMMHFAACQTAETTTEPCISEESAGGGATGEGAPAPEEVLA